MIPARSAWGLQFAVYCGWSKVSIVNQTILDAWSRIEAEGGITPMEKPAPL